jgi:hypothetical protein
MAPPSHWLRFCRKATPPLTPPPDLVELADLALAQLPAAARDQPVLVRSDSAGASHGLVGHLRARGVAFSVGFDLDERVRAAILAIPPDGLAARHQRRRQRPRGRRGGRADRSGRPVALAAGQPAHLPPRRPHPGAQRTFSDLDGHRFQAFITDQHDPDLTVLKLRHRQHARVGQRIRGAKATGLANLPWVGATRQRPQR